nr:hypothetical protein [Tanacetum cinerariifolium]
MTGNISYLTDYEPYDGGYVSFGQGGCKITSKETIQTGKLEFENVYFMKDIKTPRQHNMYTIDLNNIVSHKDLTCLVAKASADESMLWHRRLGKQHKASCKTKLVNSVTKPLHTLHMDLFGPTSALGFQNPCYLKKAQQLKPNMYDGSVIGKYDIVVVPDSEETLMLAEESRSKTNFLVPMLSETDEPNLSGTTIVEVPKELPKVSMVNSCLKKLKFHLASFDMVVKERTTATAITEGTWGFEHTKACFRDDIIPLVKKLKELFTSFDQCLIDAVTEVQNIFKQMELAVEQHCAEKTKFQTKMENILQENDRLLTQALSVEIVNIVVHDNVKFDCLNVDACVHYVTTKSELKPDFIKKECYETLLQQYRILETHCIYLEVNNQLNTKIFQRDTVSSPESAPTFAELFVINDLKAQIQEKDTEKVLVITALKEQLNKLKGKAVLTEAVSLNPIDLALLQVDVASLVPKLHKNMTAHTDYIRHTQEEAATLREIVESERLLSLLNTSLAYVCKYTRLIQELLMILQQTCPSIIDLGTKLVAVTPKNNTKQIRRTAQITKSERTTVATSPSANIDSNTPVLSSTGVTLVSSASGSKSQDNTKKNRIRITQKKVKKTELKDHLRTVKFSLNKASIVDSKATSSVIKSVSNVNSNLKCASCNGCVFSDNHDACVVAYINSVNASKKSKSVKTSVKRKVWKPTGIVFKTVGYIWKPTRRTFTLVGNVYPLTRIATATIVPHREPIPIVKSTNKPVVTLVVQIILWYLDSGCSKHMTGDRSQLINFAHKFLGTVKFENNHVAKIMGYGDYQIGNVIISRVYYVEGLGHNLFSVGQFCDSDLELAFHQHTSFIRNLDGVDLLTGSRGNNLYTLSLQDMLASSPICLLSKASKTKSWLWHRLLSHLNFGAINHLARQGLDYYEEVGISHETTVARSPQQNGVVERRNRTLIEAALTMLIYAKAPLFLWAEAVATACFTQNRSIIRLRHGKTSYELLHSKLPDLSFFYVFGALCYPTNNSENLGKLQPKADIGIFIGYAPNDWDLLFQPLFDELLNPPPSVVNQATEVIAPIAEVIPQVDADSIGSPSSTTVDQDAPSPSKSPTPTEIQSLVILQDVGNDNLDIEVAHMGNDPLLGVHILKVTSEQSLSTASPQSNVMNDWDLLFQSLFDELLSPPLSVVNQAAEVIAP